jgi:16S rRNA C967 or C1407 C5-methylase (RsmB/RsmF family)/NOL1/NOP2/fmu family ribosome biogenesis protein
VATEAYIPLPEEFKLTMREVLGDDAERLFQALDTTPDVAIRLNPAKVANAPEGEPVPWCRFGRYLGERPQFTLDPLMHGGAYYVQEASSQFVEHLMRDIIADGCRVLDMCAAPGGKSTVYSMLAGRDGLVVANDISRSRALALKDNVERWGMGNVVVTNSEPRHIAAFEHFFDVVAVDAPCSGEGMFRKMMEAREEWSPSSPAVCSARQREILAEAWLALRPGGTLLYSTCTFNPSEDEDIVRWLMEEYGDELEESDRVATEDSWGIVRSDIGAFQCFHFYPHSARGEGFFAAIARKKSGTIRRVMPKARKKVFAAVKGADADAVARWVDEPEKMTFRLIGEDIYGYRTAVVEDITRLAESLTVLSSGVEMGQIFKGKLKPAHALSLYVGLNRDAVPVREVSLDDARNYLRRADIAAQQFDEGINAVSYGGVVIGFVKRIGNRCNNMYPKELRIQNL